MWRNKEQSTEPSVSSGRVMETWSSPKVPSNSSPSGTTVHASWLTSTMRVKGEISANEDLLIDGKIEGSVSVGQHKLTVGHTGQVTGGLAAGEIVVQGKVDGNQKVVSESIEIKKDASVIGEVTTRRIVIEDGAGFKGSIDIEVGSKQVDSNLDKPTARTLSKSA